MDIILINICHLVVLKYHLHLRNIYKPCSEKQKQKTLKVIVNHGITPN